MNILLLIILLFLLSCSSENAGTDVAGFGSETTNGITIGLTGADDYSNVVVKSVPHDFNPAVHNSSAMKTGTIDDSGLVKLRVVTGQTVALYAEDTISGKKFYIPPVTVNEDMQFKAEMKNTGSVDISFLNSTDLLDTVKGYIYIEGYPEYVALADNYKVTSDSTLLVHFKKLPAALLPAVNYAVKKQNFNKHLLADSVKVESDTTTEIRTQITYRYLTKHNSPLISDTVTEITFDQFDNRIWIGTSNGAMEYTNEKFYSWNDSNASFQDNLVTSICQSSDSVTWFGTLEGVSRYANGGWVNYRTEQYDFLNSNRVSSMVSQANGTVWIGTDSGLTYYTGDTLISYDDYDLPSEFVTTLALDCTGTLWGGTMNSFFRIDPDNSIVHYQALDTLEAVVLDILVTKKNKLVVCSNSGALFFDSYTGRGYWITPQVPISSAEEDSEGNIWLANSSYGHLLKYTKNKELFAFVSNEGYYLPGRPITKITVDENDNVYCGTVGFGLFLMGPNAHSLFYQK